MTTTTNESPAERGEATIKRVLAQSGDQVRRNLAASPRLARYIVEAIYGDVFSDQTLDDRTRELVTVVALATLGTARPQLETHIGGALHCGWSREQIVEMMVQLAPFAGVAAAINGTEAAQAVFRKLDATPA